MNELFPAKPVALPEEAQAPDPVPAWGVVVGLVMVALIGAVSWAAWAWLVGLIIRAIH